MQTTILSQSPAEIESEALVAAVFEKEAAPELETLRMLDAAASGWIQETFQTGEISGKPNEFAILHRPAGLKAKRLVLAGAGRYDQFGAPELRRLVGAVARKLKGTGVREMTLVLDPAFSSPAHAQAAVEGAILGDYEPDRHKTGSKDGDKHIERLNLAAGGSGLAEAAERGRIIAEAQNFARDLVNEPANLMTPTQLAERAREMAAAEGLECDVLDRDRMRQIGMGSLLGVAQGSAEPPALIVLRYRPAGEAGNSDHLGIVGKGVTFDTGGISIKPSDSMEKMKYDMAGGAAAIGAMRALARLKPRVPVTAFIPAVENMPGSRAQRPGDIVKSLAGRTIEVLNTDAEGRLILVDAIEYAKRRGCTHLIDAATLTGAIVVALGHVNVGVFANNDALLEKVLRAARAEGEKMWHMPLDDEYKEVLKSAFADMPNIGDRWGGAITAAMFLKEWAGDTPWVHLDIAGTAWLDDAKPFLAKGPSGVGVRTFVHLAMNW